MTSEKLEIHNIPGFNLTKEGNYSFQDDEDVVHIQINCDSHVDPDQIKVEAQKLSLTVYRKGTIADQSHTLGLRYFCFWNWLYQK